MILEKLTKLKVHYFLTAIFIGFSVLSCDDDIREVTLYEKGTAEASVSANIIQYGESVDFSSLSTKVYTLNWTFAGGSPSSSTDENVTVTYNTPGTFEAKLTVKYIDNTTDTKTFTIIVEGPDTPIPYGGVAVAIPGTIEAENYNLGGEGVGYHDAEAENKAETATGRTYRDDDGMDVEVSADGTLVNLGYTNADEWALYTVEVAQAGSFDFDFKVASGSATGGKSIKLQSFNESNGAITDLGETGDFANTGGWATYVSAPIAGVNLAAGINHLRILFTGGSTNLDKIIVTAASTGGGGGGVPLGPLNIAIATNNVANEAGYIAALESAGHTVEAIASKYENLTDAGVATLNGFDLVIISRNNNSGTYGGNDPAVRARWKSVTTPVIIISPYVARMSRLQLLNNDGGIDGVGTSLNAVIQDHPVFTGINLTAGNTGDIFGTGFGAHVVDTSNPGNGTLIATVGTGNYVALAEWNANTEFYTGSSPAAGKRMFMAASSTYDFNEIGTKYFLNVVEYIVSGSVYTGGSSGPVDGLGFYTERETTAVLAAEKPASNSGNFNISYVTNAAEGSEAIYANFATSGTGNDVTWGAMVSMYPSDGSNRVTLNVSSYNYYNISLKAPAENTKPIRLRFRTSGGNYWVVLNNEYGFARDGQWHSLKIPLSDLKKDGTGAALDADRAGITEVIFRSDGPDAASLGSNFDWYIDDIYFTAN